MSKGTPQANKKLLTSAPDAAPAAQEARVHRFTLALGYGVVGLSVIGGFVMSFWPQVFGMRESNPAIGFGVAALAGFRLYALRKEIRRQSMETAETDASSIGPKRRLRASAKRTSQEGHSA